MATSAVKREAASGPRGGLLWEARCHILCRPHTAKSLSLALGISVATVARLLRELRREVAKEGGSLVSIKEGPRWRYEVRERGGDAWASDPFVRAIGFASNTRRLRGQSVDEALYGRERRRR